MSTIAAGIYIRTLREARHLSRAKLAAIAGTHESQIERIEKGEQDTRGSLLVALVQAVRGNLDQIGQLLLSEIATVDDGRELAQAWLTQQEQQALDRFATHVPDAQVAAVLAQIEQLQADPDALFRLRGYLERLVEEHLDEQQQARTQAPAPLSGKRRRFPWRRQKDDRT